MTRNYTGHCACGDLDRPGLIEPKFEIFTKGRLGWLPPLDVPRFEGMAG